ncbi:MAG: rhamnogalacturonan acetylesterase [Paludibacteraceae bacterium]|nr:rhamnogalacturonan acetylesterase [Paludibacteraceae bacterium]MCR5298019.1 rhamnogalacturonan acetylesterase [Paludibacteraceae bacterium]
MKKLFLYSLLLLATFGLTATKQKAVRIFMAGDSTMADKEKRAYPETGWGQVFPSYFDEDVVIENHSRNGRSTRTFISEGRWDFLMKRVGKGDYVIIQFGHNDQSKSKADRYTEPEQYKANLKKMVTDVRNKKAIPILCTPVERRKFDKNGNFVDQHGNYPNLVRQVAKENGVILIDMHHSSMDFLTEAGEEKSATYFLHIGPGESEKYPEGKKDNTHFKPEGAMQMARLFIEEVQQKDDKSLKAMQKHILPAIQVKQKYSTPVEGIDHLQNTINHQLDEGEKVTN